MSVWREISKLWKEQQMRMWWRHTKLRWLQKYANLNPKYYEWLTSGVCPMCEKHKEPLFPINMELCLKCGKKLIERKGEVYFKVDKRMALKEKNCIMCRKRISKFYPYMLVNTKICHECTGRLARNENKIKKRR